MYSKEEIENLYQNILEGKIKRFPNGFWSCSKKKYHVKIVVKYLFEKKLKWNFNDIRNNISARLLRKYHLNGMLYNLFGDSCIKLLDTVYPKKFHAWELKKTPPNYWTDEHISLAVKYIVEKKLKWSEDDIKTSLTKTTFLENGLKIPNKNSYELLNIAYPNKYTMLDLKNVSHVKWNKQMAINSTKHLLENTLNWSETEIKKNLTAKVFIRNDLGGLITSYYKNNIFNALNDVYPNKFKPWELKRVVWTDSLMIDAIKWLVEDIAIKEYNCTFEEIPYKLKKNLFKENKLDYLLKFKFNNSMFNALNYAYPKLYKKEQFIYD